MGVTFLRRKLTKWCFRWGLYAFIKRIEAKVGFCEGYFKKSVYFYNGWGCLNAWFRCRKAPKVTIGFNFGRENLYYCLSRILEIQQCGLSYNCERWDGLEKRNSEWNNNRKSHIWQYLRFLEGVFYCQERLWIKIRSSRWKYE